MKDTHTLGGALALAARGWHVFPCQPGGKRPMVRDRWEERATADPDLIARHWPDGANIGVACGPSGLVVIDLDTHGELPDEWAMPGVADGTDVYAAMCEWAGETRLPVTYWTATPSGGWHFYFTAPDGIKIRTRVAAFPLIDVRAAGGYAVGAGSVADGHVYEVIDDTGPAPLPGWIARELTRPPAAKPYAPGTAPAADPGSRLAGLAAFVEQAPEGQRNDSLNWAAWQARELVARGAARDHVAGLLIAAACTAGLPETEARRTVASGMGT